MSVTSNKKGRVSSCFGRAILLTFTLITTIAFYSNFAKTPGEKQTPAGYLRNQSHYVTMPDGIQIAVDIWLPADLAAGTTVPTIIETTRYWRDFESGIVMRFQQLMGDLHDIVATFNPAGYAVVLVDARGSGASFGNRPIEWSPAEVADMATVIDWIIAQPWSDGKVGGYGVSYSGNTAELLSTTGHPAVRAVAPHYADFDPQIQLATPGGVLNHGMVEEWSASNSALDQQEFCYLLGSNPLTCTLIPLLFSTGIKTVNGDVDTLHKALADHATNVDVFAAVQSAPFRDDLFADSGQTIGDVSPYNFKVQQEVLQIPTFITVGWQDAGTVDGALSRYMTFDTPQQVVIAAVTHGGDLPTDPYLGENTANPYTRSQQTTELLQFFDTYLKEERSLKRSIRYYTMGENKWKMTEQWPPAGIETRRYWFSAEHSLTANSPSTSTAADTYKVDFTATTGDTTRWHTQINDSVVAYPNRTEEDKKLLTYTTAPLKTPIEITGNPIVTLFVDSTTSDNAFHVYLESVAADGTVTYITEGMLRGINRKISAETPPYVQTGPYHSFLRQDAQPLIPNEIAEISFQLYATSVLIPAGHSIRIAIAGHDGSVFARYPSSGTPIWTIHRNTVHASSIQLPIQTR